MKEFLRRLDKSENKKISLIRVFCAIFGGFFIAYFGLAFLSKIFFNTPAEALMVSLLFNTLAWVLLSIWILLSPSVTSAFFKAIIPSLLIIVLIFITL